VSLFHQLWVQPLLEVKKARTAPKFQSEFGKRVKRERQAPPLGSSRVSNAAADLARSTRLRRQLSIAPLRSRLCAFGAMTRAQTL